MKKNTTKETSFDEGNNSAETNSPGGPDIGEETKDKETKDEKENFQIFLPKKLSPKTILGSVAAFFKRHVEPVFDPQFPEKQIGERLKGGVNKIFAFRIVGILTGLKPGETAYGEYIEFRGSFMAIDGEGNQHKSTKAFLPTPIDQMLVDAYENGDCEEIQFAFDIYLAPNNTEKGGAPYQYVSSPLIQSEKADPCEQLAARCNQLMLPGARIK